VEKSAPEHGALFLLCQVVFAGNLKAASAGDAAFFPCR